MLKTIERVSAAQLSDYLVTNNLYAPNQSAYRKFHFTGIALVRIQNDILNAVDQHLEAVLVLIDFSAASDTLFHPALLQRLCERYGIIGNGISHIYKADPSRLSSMKRCRTVSILMRESLKVLSMVPLCSRSSQPPLGMLSMLTVSSS